MNIVTIGGYGFDESGFFQALTDAKVELFVDIRQRRGLRGSRYAFLNSRRLQEKLKALGVRYVHRRELAPTTEVRDVQKKADAASGELKRSREQLSPAFVDAYKQRILAKFDPAAFVSSLGRVSTVALFCVERSPLACHRSIVAACLEDYPGVEGVRHLCPERKFER